MTHDERRLLCLVARVVANAIEEHDAKMAREIRVKVGLMQRDANARDAARREREVRV